MDRIYRVQTTLPDVQVAYLHKGGNSPLTYLWMETPDAVYGIRSGIGNMIFDSNGKDKAIGEYESLTDLSNAMIDAVARTFQNLLVVDGELNKEEIENVLDSDQMKRIRENAQTNSDQTIDLIPFVKKDIQESKKMSSETLKAIFKAPAIVNRIFSVDRPCLASLDLLAAFLSDEGLLGKKILNYESIQMLRQKPVMEAIYQGFVIERMIRSHYNDLNWWGNVAHSLVCALDGKNSVWVQVAGVNEPIQIKNIAEILLEKWRYFHSDGLKLIDELYRLETDLARKGIHLQNRILPYNQIKQIVYNKKVIWPK